ncbi:MAG: phage tail protein [Microcystaceae cyanobacterium]
MVTKDGQFPELLAVSRFYIELKLDGIDDRVDAVFMECNGLEASTEIISLTEVSPQKWGKNAKNRGRLVTTKIPSHSGYVNLVLKRGLTVSMVMWDWLTSIQNGHWGEQRRDGSLTIYNQAGQDQFRFDFFRAWPLRYHISDLNVQGTAYEVETVELAVEELKRIKIN